jgi:RNA polymerase sigma factor (sigma-70 family)
VAAPDDPAPSDAQLILGSLEDPDRFGELFDRHASDVLGWFARRTGCAQAAADLMAETFASAFTSRRRFQDTGAPARAWLFTIARRQLGRYQRRARVDERARRRLGVEPVVLTDIDLERVEQLADLVGLRETLDRHLAELPSGIGQALRLRVGAGLAYPEVAAQLGCSEGAARVRVSRGLARLASTMEGDR